MKPLILPMLSIAFSFSLQLGARQLTQAVWVYPQPGSDSVSDAAARRTMIDNTAASGVTDLYVSVYQSTPNAAGRLMYPDAAVADLIQQAHRKHIKIWAAYGAPDWPSLGCAATSFPMQRMAEVNAYDAAHPDERVTDAEGNAEFPAPPRGYCIYVPLAPEANKDEVIAGLE